jgi:hypothetical protein
MEATKEDSMNLYPPQMEFKSFEDDDDYATRGRSWGLFGKAPKKEFWHKSKSAQRLVTLKGYQPYGNTNILIIAFEDGSLSSIHSSYLKEMQGGSFGKELTHDDKEDGSSSIGSSDDIKSEIVDISENPDAAQLSEKAVKKSAPKKQKEPKAQKEKLELPVDKVKFTAKIKEFTTKPNPFSDNDDEILLLEEVVVLGEAPLVIGDAWCGYSNTLKAIGFEVGELFTFEGKVVDKKFNKEILYKVNNPSKIVKSD